MFSEKSEDNGIPSFLLREGNEEFFKRSPPVANTAIPQEVAPTSSAEVSIPGPAPEGQIDRPLRDVQRHIRGKVSDLIGEIEGLIDDEVINLEWSLYSWLLSREISPLVAKKIGDKIKPRYDELIEVLSTDDKDFKYAYRGYTEDELIERAAIYQNMMDDVTKYSDTEKKARAPHKKKPISIEKLIKGLPYKTRDDRYKVASIDPAKIIKAQELWTFNVSSSVLTVYRAIDRGGISLRGSHVLNIDEKASHGKYIGKEIEARIQEVLNGGKINLRKLMGEIKGETTPVTRITKHTILLKVL